MRHHSLWMACVAAACAAPASAAPPMSMDAQATSHWLQYARLNARQSSDTPPVVMSSALSRWWLFDSQGRFFGTLVALPAVLPAPSASPASPASPAAPAPRGEPALSLQPVLLTTPLHQELH